MKEEDLITRTEEVQEVLDKMPYRTGRFVAIIISVVVIAFLFFGFIIEYPEKVSGLINITASQAPVKLVSNASGKLHLLKNNSVFLDDSDIIAYIDNPADFDDILILEKYIKAALQNSNSENLSNLGLSNSLSLGELNSKYYTFLNACKKLAQYHNNEPFEKKRQILQKVLISQLILKKQIENQLATKINALKISEKSTKRDSLLFKSLTISELDIERSSINYFNVLQNKQAMEQELISVQAQINNSEYDIDATEFEQLQTELTLRMDVLSGFNELIAGLGRWKQTYCFISPFKGKLEYLNFWQENDFVSTGTESFSIIPSENPILGQIYLPSYGAGKVKKDQDVIIKLDNYPYIEYGSINGKVSTISQLSNLTNELGSQNKVNSYLITVDLPSRLTTNYGIELDFKYELKGAADILTKRRKLLERLFDNLKYITSTKENV